jgi:type IV pilus assembly protein PilA
MSRVWPILSVLILTGILSLQNAPLNPPPPQSAREALLETFLGSSPDHFERHLPDVARKALRKLDLAGNRSVLAEFQHIGEQVKSGGPVETHNSGPTLLVADQGSEKVELIVERDDLVGEEDQIEISFHTYRDGHEEMLPVLPRLIFAMKTEANVWRLEDFTFSAHMPLGDADFIQKLAKDLDKKQRGASESSGMNLVRSLVTAEVTYAAAYPDRGFTCSLSDLGGIGSEQASSKAAMLIDNELAGGKKGGYVFALTGCDSSPSTHFKVAAEPATRTPGMPAFCADQDGVLKSSDDGKATTCLANGKPLE